MRQKFHNTHPHKPHSFWDILRWKLGIVQPETALPDCHHPPATEQRRAADFLGISNEEIRVTWIGHASFLIQCGSTNILIDPVYANHCGPLPLPGLKRIQAPGISWCDLPPIHNVLITHNHYDHLDACVVKELAASAHFLVPEGLETWMSKKRAQKVTPLKWQQHHLLANDKLRITCLPAQHASARTPWDHNNSHWCGWLIEYCGRKIYHTGDTAYCPHFKQIGEAHGPIDLALIPIGAYSPRPTMHMMHCNVPEAVQIHLDIHAKHSIGCHWGTFPLTAEPLSEPPALLKKELQKRQLPPTQFTTIPIGGMTML